jgi:large-conductance mechanosensitive channel
MKKLIDFLIIFLLSFLIINLFTKKENTVVQEKKVSFEVSSQSYKIPASVILKIKNNTSS